MGSFFSQDIELEAEEKYIITRKYVRDEYADRKSIYIEWLIQILEVYLESDKMKVRYLSGNARQINTIKYISRSNYNFEKHISYKN